MSRSIIKNTKETVTEKGRVFDILFMLKTVAAAYAVSVVLLLGVALIATLQSMSDKGIEIMVNLVTAIGVLVCGFLTGRRSQRGGLLSGAVSGVIYTLVLCLVGNLISQHMSFGISAITAQVIGLLCGAVGGIVGINTKKQKRR